MKSAPEPVDCAASTASTDDNVAADLHAYLRETWAAVFAEFHPDGAPEQIGIDDDFFALGGTSVLAMMVLSRIYDELGVELHFRVMLEQPTVRQLAAHLSVALSSDGGSL